jgi:hypothetical protein
MGNIAFLVESSLQSTQHHVSAVSRNGLLV